MHLPPLGVRIGTENVVRESPDEAFRALTNFKYPESFSGPSTRGTHARVG